VQCLVATSYVLWHLVVGMAFCAAMMHVCFAVHNQG
jgi:hypothetical protein